VVAQTQDADLAEQFESMYDAPELPSGEEMAREREETGELSLKESMKRISTWCSVHLFPLGFRLEKQTLEKDFGDLSYVRITTEGWDRIELRLRKEKQTKYLDGMYFEKGLRLDAYEYPIINTTTDWKLVEKYYLNDALLKSLSWFDLMNSVAGVHQNYFLQIPEERRWSNDSGQLICAYLLSVPEYETFAIKTTLQANSVRKLMAYLDAHITPHTGIKPEYRISAPIDDPIPTPRTARLARAD
jgi:hypothetical protein